MVWRWMACFCRLRRCVCLSALAGGLRGHAIFCVDNENTTTVLMHQAQKVHVD